MKKPNSRTVHVLHPELYKVLEVSRSRARILAERDDFPAPEYHSVGGAPIWELTKLRAWNKKRLNNPSVGGRPRKGK